jgi:signal transduction histidine kinase
MVARNMEVENETAATTAAAQQQPNFNEISVQINMDEQFHELMNQVTVTMQLMAHQKEEINELRNIVAELRKQQQEQGKYIDELLAAKRKRNQKKWWEIWK